MCRMLLKSEHDLGDEVKMLRDYGQLQIVRESLYSLICSCRAKCCTTFVCSHSHGLADEIFMKWNFFHQLTLFEADLRLKSCTVS